MQQQGGSGSASQPQYGVPQAPAAHIIFGAPTDQSQQHQVVEEASPISSRPPAAGNLEELMRLSGGGGGGSSSGGGLMGDEDVLGEEADRGGGASGNRWPRQETLALIQIRSEMDAAFRDATVKGPLWEDVSRKLAELGYKRSAKKCKEKFENVHKYYKRTKEGRAGRQDGKSYRFFSQLEALHNPSTSSSTINVSSAASHQHPSSAALDVAPVSVGIPMPMSSQPPPSSTTPVFPPGFTTSNINPPAAPPAASLGVSFSSDGSSSSSPSTEEDDGDDETEGQPSSTATGGSRKRKREPHRGESRQMMEFFEGLMKQVMQKQEAMQQRFLEAMEKREQDRMIREEAWKRQEMARLSREHEIMAQERAVSASRDAAIVSFLQKITGQTIQLPSPMTLPSVPPQPQPPPAAHFSVPPLVTTVSSQPQQSVQQVVQPPSQQQQDNPQQLVQRHQQQPPASSEIIMAVPEQQVAPQQVEIGSMSDRMEAGSSSRWPKAEVLALINLRSGLETKYQEAGPKGPLWEEISAGMQRLGYNRSAKRCKEKWENINKYYKKVKESNKKRPEDSKTCPYFHQLDALHRKKTLGVGGETSTATTTTTTGGGFSIQSRPELDQRQPENRQLDPAVPAGKAQDLQASESQDKNDTSVEGATEKPEDIVKELMEEQGQLTVDDIGDDDESEEDEEDEEDDEDESELQEERKMAYKIEFQRQNTNGRGNGAPPASFLAMVQ